MGDKVDKGDAYFIPLILGTLPKQEATLKFPFKTPRTQ